MIWVGVQGMEGYGGWKVIGSALLHSPHKSSMSQTFTAARDFVVVVTQGTIRS